MQNLDDVVSETVRQFVQDGLLFTGLDVSNEVKKTLPFARHSEVSELVRELFVSEIEPSGYAKTPIPVTLKDGSVRNALLYHSLADAWDLDAKYDSQKRTQVAARPSTVAPVTVASVAANGTVTVTPTATVSTPTAPAVTTAQLQAKDAWANLFNNQPSLFPRR
jgi:hypothetical protein